MCRYAQWCDAPGFFRVKDMFLGEYFGSALMLMRDLIAIWLFVCLQIKVSQGLESDLCVKFHTFLDCCLCGNEPPPPPSPRKACVRRRVRSSSMCVMLPHL